jgi:hypothetical protein
MILSESCGRTSIRLPTVGRDLILSKTRPVCAFDHDSRPSMGRWRIKWRGVSLISSTDNLAQSAQGFRRGANKVRKQMWWKDMKMRMCIVIGIILLLVVIIVPVAVTFVISVPGVYTNPKTDICSYRQK